MMTIKAARMALYTALFLSLFIVPFLFFGASLEAYSVAFFTTDAQAEAAMAVSFVLLAGDPVLPTPSSVIATLLAGKVGFGMAALINAIALSLASVIGYGLGRSGGKALHRVGRGLPKGFVDWIERNGLIAVLLCRPVPVLSEASLVIAGAARYPARSLLIWCCVLQSLLGIAYAFAGSGWGRHEWDSVAVLAGSVGLPMAGAFIVVFAARGARH